MDSQVKMESLQAEIANPVECEVGMSDPETTDRHMANRNMSNQAKVGLVAFASIFLAEMGDKTQLATVLLSAQSHHPVITFAGAASALVLTSLIGVWAGRWVADRVSPRVIKLTAGFGFVGIGGWVLWDVLQSSGLQ